MSKERCKEEDLDSFHGKFLYEQTVPQNHFLVKLNQVIDWSRFTKKLLRYYRGRGEVGQAPYDPTIILKMLLLSYLFDISERQAEEVVNDSLSAKYFVGLAADKKAPDHSTLSVFKARLMDNGGIKAYEGVFDEIVKVAQERGVKFGRLQIVDSVHIVADVNINKDKRRQKEGKVPRDGDARWGAKGEKSAETPGGKEKKTEYFYGYKDQVSLNASTELVTSIIPGRANDYDGHQLRKVVEKDLAKRIEVGTVTADKGYDDGENHYYLKEKGINSAIRLTRCRTEKKDENKEAWLKLVESETYRWGLEERYKVERKFGEARKWHGFERCRYIGYLRHAIQTYLTFMALNLKRVVKLLTGVSFRAEPRIQPLH